MYTNFEPRHFFLQPPNGKLVTWSCASFTATIYLEIRRHVQNMPLNIKLHELKLGFPAPLLRDNHYPFAYLLQRMYVKDSCDKICQQMRSRFVVFGQLHESRPSWRLEWSQAMDTELRSWKMAAILLRYKYIYITVQSWNP